MRSRRPVRIATEVKAHPTAAHPALATDLHCAAVERVCAVRREVDHRVVPGPGCSQRVTGRAARHVPRIHRDLTRVLATDVPASQDPHLRGRKSHGSQDRGCQKDSCRRAPCSYSHSRSPSTMSSQKRTAIATALRANVGTPHQDSGVLRGRLLHALVLARRSNGQRCRHRTRARRQSDRAGPCDRRTNAIIRQNERCISQRGVVSGPRPLDY